MKSLIVILLIIASGAIAHEPEANQNPSEYYWHPIPSQGAQSRCHKHEPRLLSTSASEDACRPTNPTAPPTPTEVDVVAISSPIAQATNKAISNRINTIFSGNVHRKSLNTADYATKIEYWNSGDYLELSGVDNGREWSGNIRGYHIGADYRHAEKIYGIALSRQGGDFTQLGQLTIKSISPYMAFNHRAVNYVISMSYSESNKDFKTHNISVEATKDIIETTEIIVRTIGRWSLSLSDINQQSTTSNESEVGIDFHTTNKFALQGGVVLKATDSDDRDGISIYTGIAHNANNVTIAGRVHRVYSFYERHSEWGVIGDIRLHTRHRGAFNLITQAQSIRLVWEIDI